MRDQPIDRLDQLVAAFCTVAGEPIPVDALARIKRYRMALERIAGPWDEHTAPKTTAREALQCQEQLPAAREIRGTCDIDGCPSWFNVDLPADNLMEDDGKLFLSGEVPLPHGWLADAGMIVCPWEHSQLGRRVRSITRGSLRAPLNAEVRSGPDGSLQRFVTGRGWVDL